MAFVNLAQAMQRTAVFVALSVAVVTICLAGNCISYAAPLLASAALLANVNAPAQPLLKAMLLVYAISIAAGFAGAMTMSAGISSLVIVCAASVAASELLNMRHPPAIALLAVVFMHPPTTAHVLCLAVALFMLAFSYWLLVFFAARLRRARNARNTRKVKNSKAMAKKMP